MSVKSAMHAVAMILLIGSAVQAQTPPAGGQRAGGTPPPFKNLQVLAKDIPRPELTAIMQRFNAALGVNCNHCHVWTAPGNASNDMASDVKTPKIVARVMMEMTTDLNAKLAANIKKPSGDVTRVTCATCHRGAAIPVDPPAPARAGTPPPPKP